MNILAIASLLSFTTVNDIPYYPPEAYTGDYMRTYCKLNLRVPKDRKGFATVVWFHGGGLVNGTRGGFYRTPQDDVASVSAGYRLLTNATPTECLSDAGAVVAWTLKHIAEYGGDPRKVFLSGSSGGGYLSLMVGMNPKWLKPYGLKPTDLAGLLPQTGQASTHFTIRKKTGDLTSTYVTKVDEWAPLAHAARDLPPMLIQTGEPEIDIPCRAEENRLLYASLLALGHPDLEWQAYPGRRHGTMARDVKPFESDFIHRRIRAIDGVAFSTGDNPIRTCLERAVAGGLDSDLVSAVSDAAYRRSFVCVQKRGNRTDAESAGEWLVPLVENLARARLEEEGKVLPAPGTPLAKPRGAAPWLKDEYEASLFETVLDELGMKDTVVKTEKDGSRKWVTTAEDAIRLGELISRRGEWCGRRLLSAASMDRTCPLPFAFGNRLFAEERATARLLLPSEDVVVLPAFGRLVDDWRRVLVPSASDGSRPVEELSQAEKDRLRPLALWSRVKPFALPDMFLSETGRRITTREEWERVRRPEIRRWFETHMHGVRPVERPAELTFAPLEPDREILGGRAVRKRVRIGYRGAFGEGGFNVTAYLPAEGRSAPAFVFIANSSLYGRFDQDLKETSGYFPVEDIVSRGYAAVSFVHTDVAHDEKTHSLTGGVFAAFGPEVRTRTSWGAISAWAWGASRVLDWIETVPELDAKHVAVIGHSRCGKTALYATAVDERFAMACVNDSGCCGAKLNHAHVPISESIEVDNVVNPHWFCSAYRDWDNRDHEIPYDQHELAALIAPRLLAIGSGSDDLPSGPYGEYLTAQYCSPAWELYGKKGLVADPEVEARRGFRGFPPCDTAINAGCVSYHLRKGEHLLDSFDWKCYMDFADRHGWRAERRTK